MLRARLKFGFFTLILLLLSSQFVHAESKLYQYDGKMPFVRMMLNMMSAMGILDRLPSNGAYGSGYPSSPWSSSSSPYARALGARGIYPGSSMQGIYGNSPFTRSPWLQSPWSQSTDGLSGVSPLWGSPSWGVLPYNGNTTGTYYPYSYADDGGFSDLSGWVNEPWEESSWNSRAYESEREYADRKYAEQRYLDREYSKPPVIASVPLVQNFNYGVPEGSQQYTGQNNADRNDGYANNTQNNYQGNAENQSSMDRPPANRSPLSKLAQPGVNQSARNQPYPYDQTQADRARQQRQSPLQKRSKVKPAPVQKACVTEFCGLKKPDMNGLWVAQNGEMLGIKNNRYLWSDGDSRHLTGQIKIQNEYLLTSVDDHEKIMRFKYKLAGNRLLTMQQDGVIREFVRIPPDQFQGRYQNRGLGY